MDESLQIMASEDNAGVIVLRLKGRLDGHASPMLVDRCSGALEARLHLILNLSELTFLSSSGIGALLVLSEDFRDRGVSVRLAGATKTVRLAIVLLNLEGYLLLHDSEEAAIKAITPLERRAA